MLLSRDELMQLSAVQCVEEVLLHHMDYGRVLLRADIAGINKIANNLWDVRTWKKKFFFLKFRIHVRGSFKQKRTPDKVRLFQTLF